MMTYPNAAAGLKTLYQAKLVGLISIVLVIVPIVQVLAVAAMLIAGFLALVGLAQCRKDDNGYRTAFNMVIAGLVTNLAASLVSAYAGAEGFAGICSNILSIATDVLSLASLYFVCITTNRLLKETAAAKNLIDRGIVVWKLNVVCTVILLVCYLLRMIPGNIAAIIAGYLAIFAVIAQIIGTVLYILYLRNAYRALEAAVPPEEEVQQMM
jgi:energy-converting hydrogenase Eha subunit C